MLKSVIAGYGQHLVRHAQGCRYRKNISWPAMSASVFREEASLDGHAFASAFVTGIYREWSDSQRSAYLPVIERQGEEALP